MSLPPATPAPPSAVSLYTMPTENLKGLKKLLEEVEAGMREHVDSARVLLARTARYTKPRVNRVEVVEAEAEGPSVSEAEGEE